MQERTKDSESPPESLPARLGNRALMLSEDVIYVGIAAVLVVTAVTVLVMAGGKVVDLWAAGTQDAAIEVLDVLLLLFIVVELLFAVRATLAQRQLVAEPFLLVGIIASIKEIVVISIKAAGDVGKNEEFVNEMIQVGVLGVLVLLLGITSWLLRRKEREPSEAERNPAEA